MPRDYKHRAQKRPKKPPLPAWLWLITGILLGGFVVGLVWLDGQSAQPGGEWVGARPDRPPQAEPAPVGRVEVAAPPRPRFDFYNLLPKMEVVVPDDELDRKAPAAVAATADAASYVVQVGSFKRAADAESLKAQLALLGLEAKVVPARLGARDTRFRVRSGPFQGREALDRARRRLAASGYKGLVIRADLN